MQTTSRIFAGVDPTAGKHPFTCTAINQDCRLVAMESGDTEDVLAFLVDQQATVVAVNAPPRLSLGLVRKTLERRNLAAGQLRGSDMREAEWELRERGIYISPTPSRLEVCPAWMQMGFDLYRRL